jgi:5'-methylthioadenosine phosphorylase
MKKIAIIGGSGLDDPKILKNTHEVLVDTPYGEPSSPIITGEIDGIDIAILSRHGRGHIYPPTSVNNKANIFALKEIGCTHIVATTACGSLKEEMKRGDFVVLDQFIDFTRRRDVSFYERFEFGSQNAKHTPMAEPFDKDIRESLIQSCKKLGFSFHKSGTLVTIEGARFSTKAESHLFRSWGAEVINMSVAPEAILANEAGIAYGAIAMSTDYDCWKEDEEMVSWEDILEVFNQNVSKVKELLIDVIKRI